MVSPICVVCEKKKGPDDLFHKFPLENEELCRRWEIAVKVPVNKSSRVCTDHFEKDAYLYHDSKRLKPDAVPTIFPRKSNPRKLPTKRTAECNEIEFPIKKSKIVHTSSSPASPSKDEYMIC